jgi:hypothetical protein
MTHLRLQQRSSRAFVTTPPPDHLAVWLLDQGYRSIARLEPTEYARFQLAGERVILYWSGDALVCSNASQASTTRLRTICEPTPAGAGLFDPLDAETETNWSE